MVEGSVRPKVAVVAARLGGRWSLATTTLVREGIICGHQQEHENVRYKVLWTRNGSEKITMREHVMDQSEEKRGSDLGEEQREIVRCSTRWREKERTDTDVECNKSTMVHDLVRRFTHWSPVEEATVNGMRHIEDC